MRYALLFLSMLVLAPGLHGAASVKDGSFVTSDGIKLHYLESGTGPTILFVPGFFSSPNFNDEWNLRQRFNGAALDFASLSGVERIGKSVRSDAA